MAAPVDPRESPFYDGPELYGLTEDEKFDLKKQLRIMARNKRIAQKLGDARLAREQVLPIWALVIGVTFIVAGLALTLNIMDHVHALYHPH